MAQPPPQIELTILAAEGLKNVTLLRRKMNPYAVAFVEPSSKFSTRVLNRGGKDPVWNESMQILLPARLLSDPAASLALQVFHQGTDNTSLAGATRLLLQDLLRYAALKGNGEGDILTVQLFRPSGRPHGIIRVLLKISGNGLPGLHGLCGDGLDGGSCNTPVTGIPVMPALSTTMGVHNAAAPVPPPEHIRGKFSYAYPAPPYVHNAYLPYPTVPSPRRRRRNKKLLYGVLSGAVAAVLLGALF